MISNEFVLLEGSALLPLSSRADDAYGKHKDDMGD